MKKYPIIDEEDLLEAIQRYKEEDSEHLEYIGNSVEDFTENLLEYRDENIKALKKALVVYRDSGLLTKDSLEIVNKLIGDKKLMSKIVVVCDGSWLNNRIYNRVLPSLRIELKPEFALYKEKDYDKFERLSCKKKIDWLYNHFDYIFIQIYLASSREDLLNYCYLQMRYMVTTSTIPVFWHDGTPCYC